MKNNILNRIHWIKGASLPCLILLIVPDVAFGQNGNAPAGIALAGAVTARTESPWFALANPAAAACDSARTLVAAFTPSSLGIEGYRDGGMMASWVPEGGLRLAVSVNGASALSYTEMAAGITAAFTAENDVSVGIALRLQTIAIHGYGAATAPALDGGFTIHLNDRMRAAGAVHNITRSSIASAPLPQQISLGVAFDLTPQTTASIDLAHETRRSAGAAVGISHMPLDRLALRFGAGVTPARIAAGISYATDAVLLEYGGSYVAGVGIRHAIGIGLHW